MKIITTEPSALILDRVYTKNQTRPIKIGDRRGYLKPGTGGWGNVAVLAIFDDDVIVKRERESEDYLQQDENGDPDRLETYNWERPNENKNAWAPSEYRYYWTLADALALKNETDSAM